MKSTAASVLQIVALAVATAGWPASAMAGEVYVVDDNTIGAYPTSGATGQNTLVTVVPSDEGSTPVGVAVSGNNLFVLSSGSLLGGGQLSEYDATTGATLNGSLPVSLAVTTDIVASGGNLLVTNPEGNEIGAYTTSGTTVNAALVTGLKFPTVMAVSGNDLFVANAGTTAANGITDFTPGSGSIGEYNATTGAVIHKTLVTGLTSTGNNYPVGITVSGGNLFVTNLTSVAEYNASTGALESSSLLPGVAAPYGIAALEGNLFVVDASRSTIGEYTTSGIAVNASLIIGLGSPSAITVVPEPSACTLLAIGVAGLLTFRRRAR
jgi:PEP-CTERM motif